MNSGMSAAVVAFGELLMRLDVPDRERFVQARQWVARFTGGEANVAVALAQLGVSTAMVSRVPEHEIGQACINALRQFGVDTRFVARGGDRLGLLFVEHGASQRGTKVIYDRLHTSLRSAAEADFDWSGILDGAEWLHVSGTAPALGPNVARILEAGLDAARSMGVRISFDCSFRSALWGAGEAGLAFRRMAERCDLLFASREDADRFFEVPGGMSDDEAMADLRERYRIERVVFSERRTESATINHYSARMADGSGVVSSRVHRLEVVDRIGAGDALAAGVLYGLLQAWDAARVIEFGAAAAALSHTIPGDFNLVSRQEVEDLAAGDHGHGRIRR